jgi:NAD(P) transhydrogenase subunit alpha
MPQELLFAFYIFVLAGFLGHHVISKVPHLLHTPLMAGTNAISGISLVGSLVAITDRMLRMFKKKGG